MHPHTAALGFSNKQETGWQDHDPLQQNKA
jgi:hypothetical protein